MLSQLGKVLLELGKEVAKHAPKIGKEILKKLGSKAAKDLGKKIITDTVMVLAGAAAQKMVDKISNKNTNMTISKRLKELDKLKKKGKLTSIEYKKIRKKIIEIY